MRKALVLVIMVLVLSSLASAAVTYTGNSTRLNVFTTSKNITLLYGAWDQLYNKDGENIGSNWCLGAGGNDCYFAMNSTGDRLIDSTTYADIVSITGAGTQLLVIQYQAIDAAARANTTWFVYIWDDYYDAPTFELLNISSNISYKIGVYRKNSTDFGAATKRDWVYNSTGKLAGSSSFVTFNDTNGRIAMTYNGTTNYTYYHIWDPVQTQMVDCQSNSTGTAFACQWGRNVSIPAGTWFWIRGGYAQRNLSAASYDQSITDSLTEAALEHTPKTVHVANNGSNSNDGLTQDTPIQTISLLNNIEQNPGDSVKLARGSRFFIIFDDSPNLFSGLPLLPLNLTWFGDAALPIPAVDAGYYMNNSLNWSANTSTVFVSSINYDDVGIVFISINLTEFGKREENYTDVNQVGDYWYNTDNKRVYIKTNGSSPHILFETLIFSYKMDILFQDGLNYTIIDGWNVTKVGRHGADIRNTQNVTIINSEFSYCGGSVQDYSPWNQYGNCLQYFNSSKNTITHYNKFQYCYDACVTHQNTGTARIENNSVMYNIIVNGLYGDEVFSSVGGIQLNNVFRHNTVIFDDVWHKFTPQKIFQFFLRISANVAGSGGYDYRDNLYYAANRTYHALKVASGSWSGAFPNMNNSIFYATNGYIGGFASLNNTIHTTFAAWQAASGNTNTFNTSPQFVNYPGDLRPINSSSACYGASDGTFIGALNCSTTSYAVPGVSGVSVTQRGETYIKLNWTQPVFILYSRTELYVNGSNIANITDIATTSYNYTGLAAAATYNFTFKVYDTLGNVNETGTLQTTLININSSNTVLIPVVGKFFLELDSVSGAIAIDALGKTNASSPNAWTTGLIGNGVNITTSYVNWSGNAMGSYNGSFSTYFWFKKDRGVEDTGGPGISETFFHHTVNYAGYPASYDLNYEYLNGSGRLSLIRLRDGVGADLALQYYFNVTLGSWNIYGITYNGSSGNLSLYINGLVVASGTANKLGGSVNTLPGVFYAGYSNVTHYYNTSRGVMDIIYFNNDTPVLNQSTMTYWYNSGRGRQTRYIPPLTINPANNTVLYSGSDLLVNVTSFDFTGTPLFTINLYNKTGSLIQSVSSANFNSSTIFANLSIGTYYVNATLNNGTHYENTLTYTYLIYRIIENGYNTPINQTAVGPATLNVTWNSSTIYPPEASSVTLYNVSLYDMSGNFLRTLNTTITRTYYFWNLNQSGIRTGSYQISIRTIETNGNTSIQYRTIHYISPTVNYSSPQLEGERIIILFNISNATLQTEITNVTAFLIYNSTWYNVTQLNFSDSIVFMANISTPIITSSVTKQFNLSFSLNGQSFSTLSYNQTLNPLSSILVNASCTPYDAAMTFNMTDEENLTTVLGTINYNIYFGVSNGTYKQAYGTLSNVSTFSICINSSQSPNWTIGSGELQYSANGYVARRYYIFSNTRVSAPAVNITLYNLLLTSQTTFQLIVESNTLTPYSNRYASLIRWYPNLNAYPVVDMGLTDEIGQTVIHVKTEDVDYRIGIYELNGTLIKLADPQRFVCLTTPCTYTLRVTPDDVDYTAFLEIQQSLTYNETTGFWRYTFNDPSQRTSTMNMTVYRDSGSSSIIVCQTGVSAYTGAMSCNTSAYTGTLRAEVYRSASPSIPIAQLIINNVVTAFKSSWGLFLSILMVLVIVMIFIVMGPIAGVIGAVIALIPALYLGSVNWIIVSSIAVLGGLVIHFIKKSGEGGR